MSSIVGVGIDTVELARMRTVLDRTPRIATRAFTDDERAYCLERKDPTERFAVRFAAKEAVLKVLGEGILRVPLRDIEVVRASSGKPSIELHGVALRKAVDLGITAWNVSLTHTDSAASAVAIGLHDETHDPGPSFWQKLDRKRSAAGALLFDEAGRLLIVEQTYRSGWHLPGGGVETGETAKTALARELIEEGNIKLTGEPALHGVFHNRRVSKRDHVMLYVVRDFVQESPPVPDREIVAHGFFAIDELPEDTGRATRARIAEVFGGQAVSELW